MGCELLYCTEILYRTYSTVLLHNSTMVHVILCFYWTPHPKSKKHNGLAVSPVDLIPYLHTVSLLSQQNVHRLSLQGKPLSFVVQGSEFNHQLRGCYSSQLVSLVQVQRLVAVQTTVDYSRLVRSGLKVSFCTVYSRIVSRQVVS